MNYLVRIAHLLMIFQFVILNAHNSFVILNAHNSFVILNARCLEKGRAFTFTIGRKKIFSIFFIPHLDKAEDLIIIKTETD